MGLFDLCRWIIGSETEVADVFSFEDPCGLYMLSSSQDDYHRRGHINHRLIFLCDDNELSGYGRRI
jgi:hypothetical protein